MQVELMQMQMNTVEHMHAGVERRILLALNLQMITICSKSLVTSLDT